MAEIIMYIYVATALLVCHLTILHLSKMQTAGLFPHQSEPNIFPWHGMKLPFLITLINTSALVGPKEQLQLRAGRNPAGGMPVFPLISCQDLQNQLQEGRNHGLKWHRRTLSTVFALKICLVQGNKLCPKVLRCKY